jgi:hypothetical protein
MSGWVDEQKHWTGWAPDNVGAAAVGTGALALGCLLVGEWEVESGNGTEMMKVEVWEGCARRKLAAGKTAKNVRGRAGKKGDKRRCSRHVETERRIVSSWDRWGERWDLKEVVLLEHKQSARWASRFWPRAQAEN